MKTDIKTLLEFAGVDTTKGEAKKLVENMGQTMSPSEAPGPDDEGFGIHLYDTADAKDVRLTAPNQYYSKYKTNPATVETPDQLLAFVKEWVAGSQDPGVDVIRPVTRDGEVVEAGYSSEPETIYFWLNPNGELESWNDVIDKYPHLN